MSTTRLLGCLLLGVAASARGAAPPPARVDLLGDPLPLGAVARLGTSRLRQPDFVECVALTRDGKLAASASVGDKDVYLWELPSGKRRAVLHRSWSRGRTLTFSPDGRTLAIGEPWSGSAAIRLWDTRTGKPSRTIEVVGGARGVAFSPDGRTLAVCGYRAGLSLWECSKATPARELADPKCVGPVAFSPDGRTLASSRANGEVILWDIPNLREKARLAGHEGEAFGLVFSSDGKKLASAASDKTIRVWDVVGEKEVRRIAVEKVWSGDVRFADGDKALWGLSQSNALTRWDLTTGKGTLVWWDAGHTIHGIAFSADDRSAVFGSINGPHYLRQLDLVAKQEIFVAPGHMSHPSRIVYSPTGEWVATAAWLRGDPVVRIWDRSTGKLRQEIGGHDEGVSGLALSPSGRHLASADMRSNIIRIRDLPTNKVVHSLRGHQHWVMMIAYSPDGKTLATGDTGQNYRGKNAGEVRLWDVGSGKLLRVLNDFPGTVRSVAFSPDGLTLALGSDDIRLFDVATGFLKTRFDGAEYVAFSPDGRLLACAFRQEIGVREVRTGRLLFRSKVAPSEDSSGRVVALQFSRTGEFIASGFNTDPAVRLGDAIDGRLLHRFEGPSGTYAWALAFSPDGQTLASGHGDSTALIWDLRGFRPKPAAPSPPIDLDDAWIDLGNLDPGPAYRAVRALASEPARATAYLGRRLQPAAPGAEKQFARWIADLDAEAFQAREAGQASLAKAGKSAEPTLRAAQKKASSVEQYNRIQWLLRKLEKNGYSKHELRGFRAVAALERIDNDEARRVLKRLAGGDPASALTQDAVASLARLNR